MDRSENSPKRGHFFALSRRIVSLFNEEELPVFSRQLLVAGKRHHFGAFIADTTFRRGKYVGKTYSGRLPQRDTIFKWGLDNFRVGFLSEG